MNADCTIGSFFLFYLRKDDNVVRLIPHLFEMKSIKTNHLFFFDRNQNLFDKTVNNNTMVDIPEKTQCWNYVEERYQCTHKT